MRQIMQSLKSGETSVLDVPCPSVQPGHLLIQTTRSLISAGTERMLIEFGKANWLEKARKHPDKVRRVLDKMKTDGVMSTVEAVQSKLDQALPLGYCNVGTVIEVGAGVTGFEVGDRVLSNGKHAEVVCVPKNLCAKIPDGVDDETAAFGVLGAIALQGIRLAEPTLGERFAVTGLGLVGLLTVQLLRAHGCEVLGLDFNSDRLALARECGAQTVNLGGGQDPLKAAEEFTKGQGIDAVLITAATSSNEPVSQAANMCRKRGRIVLVGVVGLELSRDDFYHKELSFQVSCSYGPGRYDEEYETNGQDYPLPYVRWTEQRNFEAVLGAMASGQVDCSKLITHRYSLDAAVDAYGEISDSSKSLGVLLTYPEVPAETPELRTQTVRVVPVEQPPVKAAPTGRLPGLALIGSGSFATRFLVPPMRESGATLQIVASRGGVSGVQAGRKYGFREATTDVDAVFNHEGVDAIVIGTRHDTHASFVCRALEAGKHVFVEKPLALTRAELDRVEAAYRAAGDRLLMVGFNRRFAPHVQKMQDLLADRAEPKAMMMTVNAGAIPAEHWTQDPKVGGGRIIGEGCHFIDLLRFVAGAPIVSVAATSLVPGGATNLHDTVGIQLAFADGSIGTVQYLANGHRGFPKERLEVFQGGRILQLDNFRMLTGHGFGKFRKMSLWRQDKGHAAEVAAFVEAVRSGGASPIAADELFEVTRASFDVMDALESGQPAADGSPAGRETVAGMRRSA
ncbi:bi-domain-containing oxidoreductase [Maioricimonas sp. JC845]|uniref:bi-domain-containing oxidoreductase n=1 Tax=Maioricimonas sp. JC845 TaxID=3232138 RepID=UPI0034575498